MQPQTKPKGIALITGASGGIGQAIATRLGRDGYSVLVHYHQNEAAAAKVVKTITDLGGKAVPIRFSLTDFSEIEAILDAGLSLFPGEVLSVLVNNAAIHRDNLSGLMSNEEFTSVLETNTTAPFVLMRWATRKMLRNRAGSIVNVASLAGQLGNPGQANYAASKAALIAMTKTLAAEWGSRNIRVNAVAPGLIDAGMLDSVPQIKALVERVPLRRLGTPDEVAGAVAFLVSEDASYITGHTLSINGGLYPS